MMLYVFQVEAGRMMVFDTALSFKCVVDLKRAIEDEYGIPIDDQVLLVSGGVTLDDAAKVCSYSSGVDTNPIYLFDKAKIQTMNTKTLPTDTASSVSCTVDFNSKVTEAREMAATYETVVHRTNLAQEFLESAEMLAKSCEDMVHEQHLQQQGWAAVIANLEDLTADFKKKACCFLQIFRDHLEERERYVKLLEHFDNDLKILDKIPVIPSLLEKERTEDDETGKTSQEGSIATLLDWISSDDTKSKVHQIYDHCDRGLEQFSAEFFKSLEEDINNTIASSENAEPKKIKGLADRLFSLDKLLDEIRRLVKYQQYVTEAFLQNKSRASNLGDPSILPDLCDSHKNQLVGMLQHHQKLWDYQKRCMKAKNELSINLYQRLLWVICIENKIQEMSQKFMACHDNLKRLKQHLEVVQQIHLTPTIYLAAVAEVVRRRTFSEAFMIWASELACYLLTIYNEEVTKRTEFHSKFEGHFLNVLFPGMEDQPPKFATQAPSTFDSNLPKLTMDDVEELKKDLPELAEALEVADMSAITNFFLSKSVVKNTDEKENCAIEEKLVQVVEEAGLASNLDQKLLKATDSETCLVAHGLAHLKDLDKGFESETDTEEFEKVCQSPMDLQYEKDLSSPRLALPEAAATEDNLQTSRTEQDKLKDLVLNMGNLSKEALLYVRTQMNEIRSILSLQKIAIDSCHQDIGSTWETISLEYSNKEKVLVEKIQREHELEILEYKKIQYSNNEEIKCLREENSCLDSSLNKLASQNRELLDKMKKLNDEMEELKAKHEADKERCVKESEERLIRAHKLEMDNLRMKFRMVTEMDRSPSDPSLEKIPDASGVDVMRQIKEECEREKQIALEELRQAESQRYEKMLSEQAKELIQAKDLIIESINKKLEEKDLLIEALTDREHKLKLKCLKHKDANKQLADFHGDFQDTISTLEKEKTELQMQINEMSASFVTLGNPKPEASTSSLTREKTAKCSPASSSKLTIASCEFNDNVLLVWNWTLNHFWVLQSDTKYMYIVPNANLENYSIKKPTINSGNIIYFVGTVVQKNFCKTRKDANRFKVPKGTKFYHVSVKPLMQPTEYQIPSVTQSQIIEDTKRNASSLDESVSEATSQSLPNSPTKEEAKKVE